MCFILLQTHDLESLPGEKLAQWWRNTVSFSTGGVVQTWDHATLKGPGGYNTKFQCEQTKFQHVLQWNPVFRFSCRFALSNSSSEIRVKWVDFSVTHVFFHRRIFFLSLYIFTFFLAFRCLGNNLGLAWDFIQVGTSLGSLTVAAPEVILQGILHPQSQAKIWLFEGGWTEHRT